VLRIGLPSGSLQEPTFALFAKAGFNISGSSRSYKPTVDDPELAIRLLRAQEISSYVELGFLDCGLTGKDWIANNVSDVAVLTEMTFSKVSSKPTRWVIAVPEDSTIKSVKDLQGKVIATEAVQMTRKFLAKHGVKATVEFSWGATEVKPPTLADAIVEVTETGSSLRANRLRIIETLMESETQLIANKEAYKDEWKKAKINNISLMLNAAIAAQGRVGLMLNARKANLSEVIGVLPALNSPTVSQLSDAEWVALNTILDEAQVREVIPKLKAAGATGIVEYPLSKVVL